MKAEINEFFESLHLHVRYVRQAGEIVGGIPDELLYTHDASKFTGAEAEHYARQFHGDKGDPHGFAMAWLNHIHNNPHHWQYYIFPDGYAPEGSKSEGGAMPMPTTLLRRALMMSMISTPRGHWRTQFPQVTHIHNASLSKSTRPNCVSWISLRTRKLLTRFQGQAPVHRPH